MRISTLAFAAAAVAASGVAAQASDLYSPAPVSPIYSNPSSDWDGFYGGLLGTWATNPFDSFWSVGARAGFNFDLGNVVAGAEATGIYTPEWSSLDGQMVGRLGLEVGSDLLVYGDAGVGYITAPTATPYWVAGVGAEYMIVDGISVRGDYQYKSTLPAPSVASHNFSVGVSLYLD